MDPQFSWAEVIPVALVSAVVFGGLALMSNRPRGAFIAQIILGLAGVVMFIAIQREAPLFGLTPRGLAGFAMGVISAAIAGMLYHLYLGRFERVWQARLVFTTVFLLLSLILGALFLALQ